MLTLKTHQELFFHLRKVKLHHKLFSSNVHLFKEPHIQNTSTLKIKKQLNTSLSASSKTIEIIEIVKGRKRVYKLDESSQTSPLKYKWIFDNTETKYPVLIKMFTRTKLWIYISSWLTSMLLPIGYPHSVHPIYARTHVWQFIETFIGSTVSVLCSQAMLETISIGSSTNIATDTEARTAVAATAVATQWVLKDGFGEIGKLLFIEKFAKSFDSHPKTWKLVGEISSLFGSLLQLTTIISDPKYFLLFASFGFAARSIHFSIWGATHMTFTRNFAKQGNVGDVVAKDDSQMSVAHLLGMFTGVALLSVSHTPAYLFGLFGVLGPMHFLSTCALIHATRFPVLNKANILFCAKDYVENEGQVSTCDQLKNREGLFGEHVKDSEGIPVHVFGGSLKQHCSTSPHTTLIHLLKIFKNEKFIAFKSDYDQSYQIHLMEHGETRDILKSVLFCSKLEQLLRNQDNQSVHFSSSNSSSSNHDEKRMDYLFHEALQFTNNEIDRFHEELKNKGWDLESVFWGDNGNRLCILN